MRARAAAASGLQKPRFRPIGMGSLKACPDRRCGWSVGGCASHARFCSNVLRPYAR